MKKIILGVFALGTLQLAQAQTEKEAVTFTAPVIKKDKVAKNAKVPPPPPPQKTAIAAPPPPPPPPPPPAKPHKTRKAKKVSFKAPVIVKEEAIK
jgi:hypothetical protein